MSGSGRAIFARRWSWSTASEGSPRFVRAGLPSTPTMSPRSSVDMAYAVGRAEELDLARAVDQVQEDELPVAPAAEDAPRGTPSRLASARLELLGLGANRRDVVAVGKTGRGAHGRAESTAELGRATDERVGEDRLRGSAEAEEVDTAFGSAGRRRRRTRSTRTVARWRRRGRAPGGFAGAAAVADDERCPDQDQRGSGPRRGRS